MMVHFIINPGAVFCQQDKPYKSFRYFSPLSRRSLISSCSGVLSLTFFLYFFDFFDFAVENLTAGRPAWMPAAVIHEFCPAKLKAVKRQGCRFTAAHGIEAVSFIAEGKKDTSVKPGPCAGGARMRPELKKNIYAFPALPLVFFSVPGYSPFNGRFISQRSL
ncbi:MAG: hypothetical protein LBL20_01955 [Treponema sp.]|jgi:hypothetical protein|nr:hypothetical protein [Treponema sp.]